MNGELGMKIATGLVELIVAVTGRSRTDVTEELIEGLKKELENPPRPMAVDADKMREAFERAKLERTNSEGE